MKHIFIINPKSGKKDSTQYIKNYLQENFCDLNYEIYNTKHVGDAIDFVKTKCENKTEPITFYACGGDGTLNEVANGVMGYDDVYFTVYPCGSGNDFVKVFGKENHFKDLSKLITSCIWTILAVIFYAFSSTLMGSIFFGFDITGSQIANIVLITLQQIPVYVSVIVIGHMFVFMTQKVASSMLLYIGSFMLFETVVPLLDLIIDLPFKISLLMPLYQLIELTSMETDLVGYLTIYIS